MSNKQWGIPIALFLASMALLFYYSAPPTYSSPSFAITADSYDQILIDGLPQQITNVSFSHYDSSINIKLEDKQWIITNHNNIVADSTYIYNTLVTITDSSIFEPVETTQDLASYGITSDSKKLTLSDETGAEFSITLGKIASGSQYYVHLSYLDSICVIDKYHFDQLSANLNVWRTKEYLPFDIADTSEIVVVTNNQSHKITINNVDEAYYATSNTLSEEGCNTFVKFLQQTRAVEFVTAEATDEIKSMYSLDNPLFSITVKTFDGKSTTVNLVQSPYTPTEMYATIVGTGDIFIVPTF
ncbi:MAG: hypothetical protein ATN35_05870 [Epulopiscium sp. Nele67-Bin004]|nr:MAG: hypothetical protein ATN35_05870 [Epulopiscium sp. Nele67-Bin004]